jgi:hypothetical protein
MFSQMFTLDDESARKAVAHLCTNHFHLSPLTVIPYNRQFSILLKTHRTLLEVPSTNQKVGSSSPPGRAILTRSGPET